MDFCDIQDRLVLAALPHVLFDGWSRPTFVLAAQDLGLDPTMAERAFMGGAAQAVAHFSDLADRMMVADLAQTDLAAMKVPDRIAHAVRCRLDRWTPHREAVRRGLSVLAMPQNLALAARTTAVTMDAIWRAAGDQSADFSWYTRRLTLAGVYSATLLYWLDDPSDHCIDSWAFLSRRLAQVGQVTKARKGLQSWLTDRLARAG